MPEAGVNKGVTIPKTDNKNIRVNGKHAVERRRSPGGVVTEVQRKSTSAPTEPALMTVHSRRPV